LQERILQAMVETIAKRKKPKEKTELTKKETTQHITMYWWFIK
jgi:hypothetical protein